jgi:hypothetical protein
MEKHFEKEEMTVQVHDLRSPHQRLQAATRRASWDGHTRYYKNKSRKKSGTNWRGVWEFLGITAVLV